MRDVTPSTSPTPRTTRVDIIHVIDHPGRHHPATQLFVVGDVVLAGAAEQTAQERQRALNAQSQP